MSSQHYNTTPDINLEGVGTISGGPSGTRSLQKRFVAEIERRFRTLRGLIRTTVGYENDALRLGPNKKDRSNPFENAEEKERFDFPTRAGLTRAFMQWVKDAIKSEILEPVGLEEVKEGKHWTGVYIRAAYLKGVNVAIGRLLQQGVSVQNPENSEILQRPIHTKALKTLYTRAYSNLQDITDDTADQIRDELTTAYAKGWNPRKTADRMTDEIRDIQHTRAEVLARTETIHAATEANLNTYEQAGEGVVSHATWFSADDDRTCDYCRKLDGLDFTISEMRNTTVQFRGQIYRLSPPAHPRGRCSPAPSVGLSGRELEPLAERLPAEMVIL